MSTAIMSMGRTGPVTNRYSTGSHASVGGAMGPGLLGGGTRTTKPPNLGQFLNSVGMGQGSYGGASQPLPGFGGAGSAPRPGGLPQPGYAGGGQIQQQAPINYQTPQMNLTASRDPQLQAMYNDYGTYRSQLAAGEDRDATNALQRQRSLATGMGNEAVQNAARRGIDPSSGLAASLASKQSLAAQRNMAGTNVGLASDARAKQLAALSGQTGAAQASAADLQQSKNYSLNQWKAGQDVALGQAQLAALQQQNSWANQMGLLNWATGAMGNFYTG